jgi:hypothetical protein
MKAERSIACPLRSTENSMVESQLHAQPKNKRRKERMSRIARDEKMNFRSVGESTAARSFPRWERHVSLKMTLEIWTGEHWCHQGCDRQRESHIAVRAKPAFCNDVEGVTGGRGFHGIAVGDVTTGREFHRDAKAGCQVVRTEKELLREERRDRENKRQEDRTEKLNDIRNANKRKIRSRKDCK